MFVISPPENAAEAELEHQLAAAEQRGREFLERMERERQRMERYRRTAERLIGAGENHR